jgi:Bacterial capsule synthesis protein PGA_cap
VIVFCGDWLPVNDIMPLPEKLAEAKLIVNLECALECDGVKTAKAYPVYIQESELINIFRLKPAAVNLANNHVYDCGEEAFEKFLKLLEDNNINYYGLNAKPHCEIMLNSKKCAIIGSLESCSTRGINIFKGEEVEAYISKIRNDYDYVFVTPHWGKHGEYTNYPSPRQLKLARKWLATGATGIFGHHSHVFQGIEKIDGRSVYYSLGNFYFPHEEGINFAMTDCSLCIGINDVDGDIETEELFLKSEKSKIRLVGDDEQINLSKLLQWISEKLKNWSYWQWAKHVGPIYISKSDKSWKLRLSRNFIKTFPKWLVWNILPSTIFLRLGKFSKTEQ